MCCTTLLPKYLMRLTTENSKFSNLPLDCIKRHSQFKMGLPKLLLLFQIDINAHKLLTVLRQSSARFSQTSTRHTKRYRATFRARTLRYQMSKSSSVNKTLGIIHNQFVIYSISLSHPCLVIFVSATSDVMFPGMGGVGSLPRPLPYQAAEYLPGSS